jgi:hypothetical protein
MLFLCRINTLSIKGLIYSLCVFGAILETNSVNIRYTDIVGKYIIHLYEL